MIKKRGEMTFGTFLSIFGFLLVISLLLIAFNTFSIAKDPQGIIADRETILTGNAITGNVVYSGEVLSVSEIEEGISLDAGWNSFVWPTDKNDDIAIQEAFSTILEKMHFSYAYDDKGYWFNPDGIYSSYNTHSYYSTVLFDSIQPGKKYGVYLSESLVLRYDFGFESGDGGGENSGGGSDVTYEGILDMLGTCRVLTHSGTNSIPNTGNQLCNNVGLKCIGAYYSDVQTVDPKVFNNTQRISCSESYQSSQENYFVQAVCCSSGGLTSESGSNESESSTSTNSSISA